MGTHTTTAAPRTDPAQRPRGAGSRGRRGVANRAERHAGVVAGLALLLMAALAVPAAAGLDAATGVGVVDAAVAFLLIAGLDVVAGCALYRMLCRHAPAPAHAVVVSRVGYALLLAWASVLLLVHGSTGVPDFRVDQGLALAVLGLHLLITSVALRRSRLAPAPVVAATALAGAAAVLGSSLAPLPDVAWRGAPALLALGETVLVLWLLWAGRPLALRQGRPLPSKA